MGGRGTAKPLCYNDGGQGYSQASLENELHFYTKVASSCLKLPRLGLKWGSPSGYLLQALPRLPSSSCRPACGDRRPDSDGSLSGSFLGPGSVLWLNPGQTLGSTPDTDFGVPQGAYQLSGRWWCHGMPECREGLPAWTYEYT